MPRMPAGYSFKLAVAGLLVNGIYPSPGAINNVLGNRQRHNLSGKQCKWRDEAMSNYCLTAPPDDPIRVQWLTTGTNRPYVLSQEEITAAREELLAIAEGVD